MALVALSGGFDEYGQWHWEMALSPSGWIFKQVNNLAEICIGVSALYFAHRTINHIRTHDVIDSTSSNDMRVIMMTCTWIIAIAVVVGCAII